MDPSACLRLDQPCAPAREHAAHPSLSPLYDALSMIRAKDAQHRNLLLVHVDDSMQHAHEPGHPEAQAFYKQVDSCLSELDEMGALVSMTSNHGMNSKVGIV